MSYPHVVCRLFAGQCRCTTCRCVRSSLVDITSKDVLGGPEVHGHCYKTNCVSPTELQIAVRDVMNGDLKWFTCPVGGGSVVIPGYSGVLHCPNATTFCALEKPTGIRYHVANTSQMWAGLMLAIIAPVLSCCVCVVPWTRRRVCVPMKRLCFLPLHANDPQEIRYFFKKHLREGQRVATASISEPVGSKPRSTTVSNANKTKSSKTDGTVSLGKQSVVSYVDHPLSTIQEERTATATLSSVGKGSQETLDSIHHQSSVERKSQEILWDDPAEQERQRSGGGGSLDHRFTQQHAQQHGDSNSVSASISTHPSKHGVPLMTRDQRGARLARCGTYTLTIVNGVSFLFQFALVMVMVLYILSGRASITSIPLLLILLLLTGVSLLGLYSPFHRTRTVSCAMASYFFAACLAVVVLILLYLCLLVPGWIDSFVGDNWSAFGPMLSNHYDKYASPVDQLAQGSEYLSECLPGITFVILVQVTLYVIGAHRVSEFLGALYLSIMILSVGNLVLIAGGLTSFVFGTCCGAAAYALLRFIRACGLIYLSCCVDYENLLYAQ